MIYLLKKCCNWSCYIEFYSNLLLTTVSNYLISYLFKQVLYMLLFTKLSITGWKAFRSNNSFESFWHRMHHIFRFFWCNTPPFHTDGLIRPSIALYEVADVSEHVSADSPPTSNLILSSKNRWMGICSLIHLAD